MCEASHSSLLGIDDMQLHHGLARFALSFTVLTAPGLAAAATANCMSPDGACEVSNDGFDWIDCMCADGSGGGGGGGNAWAGLTELELGPICEDELAAFCGPFIPPDYVECNGLFGWCTIDNEPEDSLSCNCYDGSVGEIMGGNAWAGYSDMQLLTECEAQLDTYCVAPPGSINCSNTNGECTIDNLPDFLACMCNNGDGGSFGGGNSWGGYSELELHGECGTQLVGMCGGPLPGPPWIECSSGLGECIIDNDPEALLECTCADGSVISGGREDWVDLSDDELFMTCEEQLYEGCGVDTGSSTGTTGDPGTGDASSGDSTGEPSPDTGLDGSDTTSASSDGTPPASTTGHDTSESDSDGSDDSGAADGESSGCSCSADGSKPGWALALIGLMAVTQRRRRRSHRPRPIG